MPLPGEANGPETQPALSTGPCSTPSDKPANPFLNPSKALTVQHLSPTHSLLLNKFNVVDHHVSTAWLPVRSTSRAFPALPVPQRLPKLRAEPPGLRSLTSLLAVQVLVVTCSFEQQTAPLNEQDLEATWATVQVTSAACSCHNPSWESTPADFCIPKAASLCHNFRLPEHPQRCL